MPPGEPVSKSSFQFAPGKIKELRDLHELTQEEVAEKAGVDITTVWRAEKGNPVLLDTAAVIASVFGVDYRSISTPTASRKPSAPSIQKPVFRFNPITSSGANWKPDPSHIDESKGYPFCFYAEAEALVECSVAKIELHVMRNDHLAICTGPGKGHYYNGHLIGEEGKYGFVKIDGEKVFVDARHRFMRLVSFKAEQKFLLSIERWCRAIGISRGETATKSLWYWLDDPRQIIAVEYTIGNKRYAEKHVFKFSSATTMAFEDAKIREID